ncbi:hypothetical protein ABZ816_05870 [Actinosynnema sp. NPDC047251]|uniref:hypothetical protein n=1 Tax=Saccharothrix espanaensis TaxID=103731 RepID=UPI0002DA32FE|nr:hypothetical protein [Saccharothrix espanaensis]
MPAAGAVDVTPINVSSAMSAARREFLIDRLSERREVVSFRSSVIFESTRNPVPTELPG